MSSTAERFVRFSTDAYGLERILRLLQATVQIFMAVPLLALRLTGWINSLPSAASPADGVAGSKGAGAGPAPLAVADTLAMLGDLRGRLGTTRRTMRLFRFAESLHAAQKLYLSSSSSSSSLGPNGSNGGKSMELWLDISSRTFNGLYFLLETATLPDALGVAHLPRAFAPATAARLAAEAQRFWLLALACSAAAGALRVLATYAGSAVPETGAGFGAGVEGEGEGEDKDGQDKDDKEDEESRSKQRREEEKAKAAAARRANAARRRVCLRKMAADLIDISLPGSALGWIPVDPATVGSAMFVTTILTSLDYWERCV